MIRFLTDHLKKSGLYSDFQYVFKSSHLTVNRLTVLANAIARTANMSGSTQAVTLQKLLAGFGTLVFFIDLHIIEFQVALLPFFFISSFFINRQLRVVLVWKSLRGCPFNVGIPPGSIFGPTLLLLYINSSFDDVIHNSANYVNDTTKKFTNPRTDNSKIAVIFLVCVAYSLQIIYCITFDSWKYGIMRNKT